MSNSSLVGYTRISPNSNARRGKISKITIHHVAGIVSVETLGGIFASSARQASSNYGIDSAGRVGMFVEEKNRSWCSSSEKNDDIAVTIEVSNDEVGGEWHVSDPALARLVEICADICRRNGIDRLRFTGDTSGNLTLHYMFAPTACPGAYLKKKMPYIASEVNRRLLKKEDEKVFVDTKARYLKHGCTGYEVKVLQVLLTLNGYQVGADGIFGDKTLDRVKKYQTAKGIYPDGEVGVKTWRALLS